MLMINNLQYISKWNTTHIIDMSIMFTGCSLLIILPYISKWNMTKVININIMFFGMFIFNNFARYI